MPKRGARFLHHVGRKRNHAGLGPVLVRFGTLEARLATSKREVSRAQRLRYRVFFEEGGAMPSRGQRLTRRDVCRFDSVSDHLIVVDCALRSKDGSPECVGVYRLLRQDLAERNFGFCSSIEFDVKSLIARHPRTQFLEVGRACVAESHRGGRVLELLWRALWAYARHYKMDAMFGCASLPGVDPSVHAAAIRYLAAHGGDPSWRATPHGLCAAALPENDAPLAPDTSGQIRGLPTLVKGYWRLGATFSPAPAIDPVFGAIDLFVVLPLDAVEPRYLHHFEVEAVPQPTSAESVPAGFA